MRQNSPNRFSLNSTNLRLTSTAFTLSRSSFRRILLNVHFYIRVRPILFSFRSQVEKRHYDQPLLKVSFASGERVKIKISAQRCSFRWVQYALFCLCFVCRGGRTQGRRFPLSPRCFLRVAVTTATCMCLKWTCVHSLAKRDSVKLPKATSCCRDRKLGENLNINKSFVPIKPTQDGWKS